jgi:hypothetical protein
MRRLGKSERARVKKHFRPSVTTGVVAGAGTVWVRISYGRRKAKRVFRWHVRRHLCGKPMTPKAVIP